MSKKKRPYKRPTVRTEKVYERKSLACGKSSSVTLSCKINFKQS
jgi:hypothetical protein